MSNRLSTVISRIFGLLSVEFGRSARAVKLWGCKVLRMRVSARIATRTRCVDGEDGKLSDAQDPALRESSGLFALYQKVPAILVFAIHT